MDNVIVTDPFHVSDGYSFLIILPQKWVDKKEPIMGLLGKASKYYDYRTNLRLDLACRYQGLASSAMRDSRSAAPSELSGNVLDAIAAGIMNSFKSV